MDSYTFYYHQGTADYQGILSEPQPVPESIAVEKARSRRCIVSPVNEYLDVGFRENYTPPTLSPLKQKCVDKLEHKHMVRRDR